MPAAVAGVGAFIAAAAAVTIEAVVIGAIIGAAIGGLAAAVTGGDIGKGILFGAIGGAVGGALYSGISGAMSGTAGGGMAGVETASQGSMNSIAAGGANATAAGNMTTGAAAGGGLLGGSGGSTVGAALVSTGGQMLMKGFDNSSEIAQAEAEKNRQASKELAQLQADTQLKIEAMRGPGGGSNGDARYSADIGLLNAREARTQAEAFKSQDLNELEKARLRKAESLSGATVASTDNVDTSGVKSINEQAMDTTNKAYPNGSPQVLSGGVLNYA